MAHNLALKRRIANKAFERSLVDEDALAQHPCEGPNAEEEFSFSQTKQRLRAVFRALPAQDQRCLYLRAEGLKYRQIAKVLGVSVGGVSLSLSRSLARIIQANGSEWKMQGNRERLSDEELLLFSDQELPTRRATRAREHVAQCEQCRTRLTVLENASALFADLHEQELQAQSYDSLTCAQFAQGALVRHQRDRNVQHSGAS